MNDRGAAPGTAAARRWRPRHWRAVTLALLAAVLAVMAVLASQEPSFGWDRAVAAWLLGFSAPAYDAFMEAVSVPGKRLGVWVTMLAGAALAAWRLGWRAGALVIVGLGVMGVNEAFKDIVDRPRPLEPADGGGESFPSGHVMHAVVTSGLVWLLVMPKLSRLAHRRLLFLAMLVWPVLVGLSRVHLERHWPSDVLGAYVFGAAALIVMAWVWGRVQGARALRVPSGRPSTGSGRTEGGAPRVPSGRMEGDADPLTSSGRTEGAPTNEGGAP